MSAISDLVKVRQYRPSRSAMANGKCCPCTGCGEFSAGQGSQSPLSGSVAAGCRVGCLTALTANRVTGAVQALRAWNDGHGGQFDELWLVIVTLHPGRAGWAVVSGASFGVDVAAHNGLPGKAAAAWLAGHGMRRDQVRADVAGLSQDDGGFTIGRIRVQLLG